jgi:hypothetical protein
MTIHHENQEKEPNYTKYDYSTPTKTITTQGMTTFDDLLRVRVIDASESVNNHASSKPFVTCDLSLSLGDLATGHLVPASTYDMCGFKHSEGHARLDPENNNLVHLFLTEVSD